MILIVAGSAGWYAHRPADLPELEPRALPPCCERSRQEQDPSAFTFECATCKTEWRHRESIPTYPPIPRRPRP